MLRIQRKWALFRALWSGCAGLSKPLFITLDMTPRCNLTCVGCRHHSQWMTSGRQLGPTKSDMSLEVVEQIASKLKELGGIMLYLEGSGEPFIHPQIMAIVRRLKKAGFCLTIFTNGTLLNANRIAELIEARVNIVRFSIWAGAESTFERNYPGSDKKNFSRITESLQHFQSFRPSWHRHPGIKYRLIFLSLLKIIPLTRNIIWSLVKQLDTSRSMAGMQTPTRMAIHISMANQ